MAKIIWDCELEPGQYLNKLKLFDQIIESGKRVIVSATPNTGKSRAAIEALNDSDKRFVFVADTIPLAKDLAKYGLDIHYGAEKRFFDSKAVATIPHHIKDFAGTHDILVVDEWHTLVTDYSYKRDVIDDLLDSFDNFDQVIGLTGTFNAKRKGFELIRIEDKEPPIELELISALDPIGAVAISVISNPQTKHWISVHSRDDYPNQILEILEAYGINKSSSIKFNSVTKYDDDVKGIYEKNALTGQQNNVLSTYKQGFSLEDGPWMLHILSKKDRPFSPIDIAQVSRRFRTAGSLKKARFYANVRESDAHDGFFSLKMLVQAQLRKTPHDQDRCRLS